MDYYFDDNAEVAKWSNYSQRFGIDLNYDGSVDPYVLKMCKADHAKEVVPLGTPSLDYLFDRMRVAERSRIMRKADFTIGNYEPNNSYFDNHFAESPIIVEPVFTPKKLEKHSLKKEVDRLIIPDPPLGFDKHSLSQLGKTRRQTEAARLKTTSPLSGKTAAKKTLKSTRKSEKSRHQHQIN